LWQGQKVYILIKKRFFLFLLIFYMLLLLPPLLRAGDWHTTNQLVCSDCHTMHNSQGGLPMRYDRNSSPSPHLLRHATSLSLCIYCHDGTDPKTPDVIAPVTYVSDPAGGFFGNTGGTATGTGHNLGMPAPEPAPGGNDSLILTCVSCHDPHGNSNYRNLWLNPVGSGNTGDTPVVVNQAVKANGSNPSQVYIPSNLKYKSGMSMWCNDCHPNFHSSGTQPSGFLHPSDKQISGSDNADYDYWSGTITNRVPAQTPTDDTIPSTDDQVFCLSCHKAHGSANRSGLIFADGATLDSTCQQCHNQ
jgi:predicted CXXCH cytochrome family protein